MRKWLLLTLALGVVAQVASVRSLAAEPRRAHAIAMHGEPKYGPDYAHFDYANPNAPRGGSIVLGAFGSYDTFHPFVLKGRPADGLGRMFETMTTNSRDEAFTEYGLLAESIEWPEDRSWVTFTLRPEARWHDGVPVTVDDVIWSLEILQTKGHPFYRNYYANLASAEEVGDRQVKITFSGDPNAELPLITGQMPILPKHYWADKDFEAATLDPPVGSGPYKIAKYDAGRAVTYELDPNYWGRDLPINTGQYNFAEIRYDYYRDQAIWREALKAGDIDFFRENTAKDWATAYDIPAVQEGRLMKELIPNEVPQGMQAFVFNTRREIFADRRVREALGYAFDFEATNAEIFYGSYTRTKSYFANSELASSGLPQGEELAVLEEYRGRIPDEVFTAEYAPPVTDGSGNIRSGLRAAFALLKEAGWEVQDGALTDVASGQAMEFEILLVNPGFERVVLPYKENLAQLGVTATVRTVDTAQYQNRMDEFDFDMVVASWGQSLSPGNEQRDFWTSDAAATSGTRNYAGVSDPVVDELVDLIISAPGRESLIARTHALDRVLLWNHYVVPNWYLSAYRVVYWAKFGAPEIRPKYDLGVETWWIDADKAAALSTDG
jgi:microcin C transport system substrate-binding protein